MNYMKPACLLILAVTLLSCNADGPGSGKQGKPVTVDVLIAGGADLPSGIEVSGNVLSEEMVELYPEVSGRLVYLNIPDGARVGAGTILARINDAELQAELEKQKVQLELADKTEQRLKKLLAVNGINQAEYDAALTEVNLIKANIDILKAQIEKTIIRAPFSGRLGLRQVSRGAYVTPSTLIGTLHQADRIKIDFNVPEAYGKLIFVGKTVTVGNPGDETDITAIVTAIEPQVNTGTRNFKVRAKPEKGTLSPGTFVKISLDDRVKGIVVPTNAIIPDARSNQVVIISKGKAQFMDVETGVRAAGLVEIVSGIKEGDSVVISGTLFVRPNAEVKIKSVKRIGDLTKTESTSSK